MKNKTALNDRKTALKEEKVVGAQKKGRKVLKRNVEQDEAENRTVVKNNIMVKNDQRKTASKNEFLTINKSFVNMHLAMSGKIYAVDIDGCVVEERMTFERPLAAPIKKMVRFVNHLFDNGNFIMMYTARSWAEYKATEHLLKMIGLKYHTLIMGKPNYHYFIDDKAINAIELNEQLNDGE